MSLRREIGVLGARRWRDSPSTSPLSRRVGQCMESFVQSVWRQIGAIGPANNAEFIDEGPAKLAEVGQWLKHRPEQSVLQINDAPRAIGKGNFQPIAVERLDEGDFAHSCDPAR